MIGDWDDEADLRKFNAWLEEIAGGKFEAAWAINDQEKKHWPSAHQLWNRKPLHGRKLSVVSLHGLGDAVQMLQYAGALRAIAERVVFRVPAPLLPLASHFEAVEEVVDAADETYTKRPWMALESMELPYLFRTTPMQLAVAEQYLDRSGLLRLQHQRSVFRDPSSLQVGLGTQGGNWDRERWLPFMHVQNLCAHADADFLFLQGVPPDASLGYAEEVEVLQGNLKIHAGNNR